MTPSTKIPEEAAFSVRVEFTQDSTNGEQYRKPFVDLPDVVDTHPNEEHHEIAVDFRRHKLWNDPRHILLLLRRGSSRARATSRPRASLSPPNVRLEPLRVLLLATTAPSLR